MNKKARNLLITGLAVGGISGTIVVIKGAGELQRKRNLFTVNQKDTLKKPSENLTISIITVCYNSEDVIDKTIQSVLNQTYNNIEYIIIEGASTDSTASIAEGYREKFEKRGYNYCIISEPDNGIYDAMNKGIAKSTGTLIGFINAGDWYESDAVETVATEYENEPFDYFYADVILVRSDGVQIVKHSKPDRIATSRHWNHPSSFTTKALYNRLGGFRCEGIHDDFEFFLRVRRSGAKIRIVNEALANFKTGGVSNAGGLKKSIERIGDRYNSYRVNGYSRLYLIECIGIEAIKSIMKRNISMHNLKYYFLKACQKVFSQPVIRSSKISKKAAVWNDCLIIDSQIADYSYVSDHTSIYFTKIGKFCSIASYCSIGGAAHPTEYVSTSPVFLEGRNALKKNFANHKYTPYKETIIGNDVWIGGHSCIKGGVTIGDGAVVGMGSVVLKDIGPYEIWAGNPARFIRKRFDDDVVEALLKTRWWELQDSDLEVLGEANDTPKLFLDRIHALRKGGTKS